MFPGIKRIKALASEITDKATIKIIEYLCKRSDMDDKYLTEEKSIKQMLNFIKTEAKKKAENNIAIIEDNDVYSWAIHYWDETNEALGIKNEENETVQESSKEEREEYTKELKKVDTKRKNWVPEGQLSLFEL